MTRPRAWQFVFYATVLAFTSVSPAVSAPRDPAPIPDEIVDKLVRVPLSRRPPSLPHLLERHLDETTVLLERMESEERGFAARAEEAALPTTTHMLLGGKVHELRTVRAELQKDLGRIRH